MVDDSELDRVHASIRPMLQNLGFVRYVELDETNRRAVVEFEVRPDHCHSGNVAQGGFVTGWIDNAMATASMIGGEGRVAMSLDVKVSFFRSANPGRVIAEGWVERRGKSTAFLEGRLLNGKGEVLAKASSTARLIPRAKLEASAGHA